MRWRPCARCPSRTSIKPNPSCGSGSPGSSAAAFSNAARAAAQFDTAKALDPNDPTPWIYDAILKQRDNRPVESLQDVQTSIAHTANRAIYRSRLLLDSDAAARSASLARIYGDLGIPQLAVEEAWKSLGTDPTNYSAHRFLADSY